MAKIHSKITTIILSLLLATSAVAAQKEKNIENGIDSLMNMIIEEMKNSPAFNQNMACLGVSEQQKKAYLDQFEKDYRDCLKKFPQHKDGGSAFLTCWSPKVNASFKNLGISESAIKKCKS